MADKALLNTIFQRRAELITYVEVLENESAGPAEQRAALRAALQLVCKELTRFVEHDFTVLRKAIEQNRQKNRKRNKQRRVCKRIGRALDNQTDNRWDIKAKLVESYTELEELLAPLSEDVPQKLVQFQRLVCELAAKSCNVRTTHCQGAKNGRCHSEKSRCDYGRYRGAYWT